MQSLYTEKAAQEFKNSALSMRSYTSQLLGAESDLVLHGGGNTSVKDKVKNLFGVEEEILYVKGSGHDLKTIQNNGFSPVKMSVLCKLAKLEELSDSEMVKQLKMAMIDPGAPGPSIEAIPHAIIPFKYVDHTHADAVVTISNTENGREKIESLYGNKVLVLDFGMPGFILSKQIFKATTNLDWSRIEGIILLNHGVFTFSDSAQESYENMIKIVTMAEDYLKENGAYENIKSEKNHLNTSPLEIANLRKKLSDVAGRAMIVCLKTDSLSTAFSTLDNMKEIATKGPITPDHVIRTKRVPAIIDGHPIEAIEKFSLEYEEYFNREMHPDLEILDKAPRFAIWKGQGILAIGNDNKSVGIISDITDHTIKCIQMAEAIGGWKALPTKDIFMLEYWELEQAKLKKNNGQKEYSGKVMLITGAASGIGLATTLEYLNQGACVVALDINPAIENITDHPNYLGIICDITSTENLLACFKKAIYTFGGIDILVTNAGAFPQSCKLSELDDESWGKSINLNLTAHQKTIRIAIPFLKEGIDPSIIVVASKNVPAPGPGAGAYSAAKAGLTQLARVAALELGAHNIRVNMIHPNAVFDTGVWTKEVIEERAKSYGLSVSEYKTNNILKTEVTSENVAKLILAISSSVFSKTTGSQIPIDGGNDRVI